jgi:hypothetical protein
MPKPNGKRLRLSTMRENRAKALGGRYVEFEDDDGNVIVSVPKMAFWGAKTYKEWIDAGSSSDLDALELVMDEASYTKLEELDLELGDLRELMTQVMAEAKTPESKGSSTP